MTATAIAAGELPPALRPWRAWLGWFDLELATQVGALLARLSDLVGPAPAIASRAALEPDGLDDLRTRGTYERLLASEWLLADELPDEFLRRAAAAEHLFLSPRLRSARVERSVVAVFDCGPRQLGAARLAHIAAWILLARRAADHGGRLRWGVLQAPGALRDAASAEDLGALLAARRFEPGDAGQVARWRAAVAPPDAAADAEVETWWIGAGLPAGAAPAGRLERVLALRPAFDGDALDVALRTGTQARRARLPLPPERAATALLRAEFRAVPRPTPTQRVAKEHRLSIAKAPLLGLLTDFVAVPTLEGHAMQVFSLARPNQAKAVAPRIQRWSSARPPIAAALCGRQAAAVCVDGGTLHFWQVEGFGTRPRPGADRFEASISTASWLPMIRLADSAQQRVCVVDRAFRLVAWNGLHRKHVSSNGPAPDPAPTVFDSNVLAMVQLDVSRLAYVLEYGGGLWLRVLGAQGQPSPLSRRLRVVPEARPLVFLSVATRRRYETTVDAIAIRTQWHAESWELRFAGAPGTSIDAMTDEPVHEIKLAPGERVLGLARAAREHEPGLVVRSADRRTLRIVAPGGQKLLYSGGPMVAQCTVCPRTGRVAMLTNDRDLLVIDPATAEVLLAVRDGDVQSAEPADD